MEARLNAHFGFAGNLTTSWSIGRSASSAILAQRMRALRCIGPGSGLGMSALLFAGGRAIPIPSEGGHATMAPSDTQESAVLDLIRQCYGHASAERVLSGPGLVNLYKAICKLSDTAPADLAPTEITNPSIGSKDRCAREATGMFCDMLGTVAGNLALTLDARGGIYLAGGIVPQLGSTFLHSGFRRGFESKGRFRSYLEPIPAYVATRLIPAFLGAARLLAEL
jgi:glucokinase